MRFWTNATKPYSALLSATKAILHIITEVQPKLEHNSTLIILMQCDICDSTLAKGASDSIIDESARGTNAIGIATCGDLNNIITVRLTFLAHSVRMRSNFQGLPWFECDGLGNDELLI
jgi:hypothetical protein